MVWVKHLCRMTAVIAATAVVGLLSATSSVTASGSPPQDESVEAADTPVTETLPADTTTTTLPAETGEIDGVEVAVGLPPVPPIAAPTEVGTVDGVEVAVGTPPLPPTATTVAASPSGQRVEAPSRETRENNTVSVATSRVDAVVAATQLMESMQTIDVLLDAWS